MSFEIKPVEINDVVVHLINNVHGTNLTVKEFLINTNTYENLTPLYLGAFFENQIIGFNAFIPHQFQYQTRSLVAYQVCWTATDPNFRGKGIFQNIIETAKLLLKNKYKAKFILGFPNQNSYPIFTQKLGFKDYKLNKFIIPNFKLLNPVFFDTNHLLYTSNSIFPNEHDIYEWKCRDRKNIFAVENKNGFMWGIKRKKKTKGFSINFLEIGGMSIKSTSEFPSLLDNLFKKAEVKLVSIQMHSSNPYHGFFKRPKPGHTLIIFDLDDTFINNQHSYCVMSGILDTF